MSDDGSHDDGHGDDHHDDEHNDTDDHQHDTDERHHDHDDHGHDHDHHHGDVEGSLSAAVLTISSTRTPDDDASGDATAAALEAAGHDVAHRGIVTDDEAAIREAVAAAVERGDDVVVTTGGTGVTDDDCTIEAVRPLFDTELPGVGERFRRLSEDQIGARAVLSRATGGVVGGTAVFAFPGSPDAARLGVDAVVAPVAGHLVGLARQ